MRRLLMSVMSVMLVAMLAVVGIVAAQDDGDTPTSQPYLGINFDEAENGVLVTFVGMGTPAEEAGLAVGDIITAVDETEVSTENFVDVILGYAPEDEITLTVERDDETVEIVVTLGERINRDEFTFTIPDRPFNIMSGVFLGVEVNSTDDGIEIVAVTPDSPAEEAGLQVGDLLIAVNGEAVTDVREVIEAIAMNASGDEITLTVSRAGEEVELTATLDEMPDIGGRIMMFGMEEVNYLADEGVWEIVELADDSPLAEIGLEVGDRITAINGESLSQRELSQLLRDLMETGNVTLTVERGDETLEVDASITALLSLIGRRGFGNFEGMMPPVIIEPRGFNFDGFNFDGNNNNRVRLGVTYVVLDEQSAVEYESDVTEGAYITQVDENSPADQAGLQVGDVIVAVDGDIVDFERTLSDRLYAYEVGDVVTLEVLRDGETLELEATLGGRERRADVPSFFNGSMSDFPFDLESIIPFELMLDGNDSTMAPVIELEGSDL